MDTYEALFAYFSGFLPEITEMKLTFTQIERILGRSLPPTAWHYRTWWEHPGELRQPPQVQAWTAAGWRVEMVDQHNGWAWFKRIRCDW
jgi:hypothetical protein